MISDLQNDVLMPDAVSVCLKEPLWIVQLALENFRACRNLLNWCVPRILKVPLDRACKEKRFMAEFYTWEDKPYYQSVFSSMMAMKLRDESKKLGHSVPEKNLSCK